MAQENKIAGLLFRQLFHRSADRVSAGKKLHQREIGCKQERVYVLLGFIRVQCSVRQTATQAPSEQLVSATECFGTRMYQNVVVVNKPARMAWAVLCKNGKVGRVRSLQRATPLKSPGEKSSAQVCWRKNRGCRHGPPTLETRYRKGSYQTVHIYTVDEARADVHHARSQ